MVSVETPADGVGLVASEGCGVTAETLVGTAVGALPDID